MGKRDEALRNLEVQKSAGRRDAATLGSPDAEDAPAKVAAPIDNEALTLAVRATLEQRKTRKRAAAAATTTPAPDRSLDQLMATYGRSKPRRSKSTSEE